MQKNPCEGCIASRSGVRIYYYPNRALHSFHVSLFVRAGSMHEGDDEGGISHFFEHAAIRNVNRRRDGRLYSELDRLGVEFNASTYSEMIQFYVSGAAKNFDFATDILLDVLSPIVLSAQEISEERSRIKAEMRESDERTSLTTFTNAIVHEGTTLSRSITGTVGSINRITKTALESFRQRVLTSENVFLYVTGNVSDGDVMRLADAVDRHGLGHGGSNTNVAPVSRNFAKRRPEIHIKNADFTMARFTFDLDMTRITLAEADLIYDILLSGYNSEFFIELSEKRGLFYDVSGALERYDNIGTLSFSFEVREAVLYEAVEVTADILARMKRDVLPDERCMRAAYVDNAYMLVDDPRELNFTFAYDNHIMSAGYGSIEDRIAAYSSVSAERIRDIARVIFRPENLTFTMKGCKKRIDTERIQRALSAIEQE